MTADSEALALERFMTARLDEAEAAAKAVLAIGEDDPRVGVHGQWNAYIEGGDDGWAIEDAAGNGGFIVGEHAFAAHIALNDPVTALRSIAADRRLLAELARCEGDPGWDSALMLAARCRATAWDTHPDYLDRWKP